MAMRGQFFTLILTVIFSSQLSAQVQSYPEIGDHYPIFIVEKKENPENIMVGYVKLRENCDLLPQLDFYWLINKEKFKPVHPLIQRGIRQRIILDPQDQNPKSFYVTLKNPPRFKEKTAPSKLMVESREENGGCYVEGLISDPETNEPLKLMSFYSESKPTLVPPFKKLSALRITGKAQGSDMLVVRHFSH